MSAKRAITIDLTWQIEEDPKKNTEINLEGVKTFQKDEWDKLRIVLPRVDQTNKEEMTIRRNRSTLEILNKRSNQENTAQRPPSANGKRDKSAAVRECVPLVKHLSQGTKVAEKAFDFRNTKECTGFSSARSPQVGAENIGIQGNQYDDKIRTNFKDWDVWNHGDIAPQIRSKFSPYLRC